MFPQYKDHKLRGGANAAKPDLILIGMVIYAIILRNPPFQKTNRVPDTSGVNCLSYNGPAHVTGLT